MAHDHVTRGPVVGRDRSRNKRALALTLALTSSFTVAELIGGVVTGSLSLLADAGHMLSDDLSLGLALFAIWLAERPPTPRRSFGYQRAEILAALANGATLVVISAWIFYEAYNRLQDPPEVLGGWMLAVATLGLTVNVAGAFILSRGRGDSLNVSAALRHVLADLAGSVGVIAASVIILTIGWRAADPLTGALIGALVLASAWGILRDSLRVLLEQAPRDIDAEEVGRAMAAPPGVVEVHDQHLWTITSGFPALAAHILVEPEVDCHERRRALERMLAERFGIEHTTLQVDHAEPRLLTIQAVEEDAEVGCDETGADAAGPNERRPGAPQAFVFADIVDFTLLTEGHGDERAGEAVEDPHAMPAPCSSATAGSR